MKSLSLVFFIFLVYRPIDVRALQCYGCSSSNGAACDDTFDSTRHGLVKFTIIGGACWKYKTDIDKYKNLLRGGGNGTEPMECPKMNTCKTQKVPGGKATICCCQDKDLCNTATTNKFMFPILTLSLLLNYIYVRM